VGFELAPPHHDTGTATNTNTVIRAAIDIGSGGPKLRIAEVDLTTNRIIKILHVEQYPVIFQESVSKGGDQTLDAEIMLQGILAIKEAIALAKSFKTEGLVMIGTSVFRNAANGQQFANVIYSEVGLPVHILDQELEAKLAFQAVLAKTSLNSEDLVVWDTGGGSTQFIGVKDGLYLIDQSNERSGP
jgi:exopolyphosphatase/guanosine-5'-triphosphate,3'-diphosphate pyrophosphatase